MRDNIYFKWFQDSLSDNDKEQFRQMSTNQQKDWYISWLENAYQSKNYFIRTLELIVSNSNDSMIDKIAIKAIKEIKQNECKGLIKSKQV